ncbi:hypothetical protein GIB67_027671 [Kingdonia uniflora]|uniref:Uncharacterized protein n=1 Tax=Kingdonia uniflora TaxID=39325 RepID=A0A7J7NLD1_9MAGN|nr:hypothetical protein GIB67_027671 [Kingdonia uniflora]
MGVEENSVLEKHDESTSNGAAVSVSNQEGQDSTGIVEESPHIQQWRRQNLFLNIPSRNLDDTSRDFVTVNIPITPSPTTTKSNIPPTPSPSSAKINASPGSSSSKGKSFKKNRVPRLSFKHRNSSPDIEKAAILLVGNSTSEIREKPTVTRSSSLTKIFTPRINRTSSLPVTPIEHSNPNSVHGRTMVDPMTSDKKGPQKHISRSLSVPMNNKGGGIRRMDSIGGGFRVIPSTPRVMEGSTGATSNTPTSTINAEYAKSALKKLEE